jgi:rubrerythrin
LAEGKAVVAETREVEVLKTALLLERQGQAFYGHVAATTGSPAVAAIFRLMASEEARHEEYLARQFAQYAADGTFRDETPGGIPADLAREVLTREVRDQISASGYEAAAISAAIEMENRAVRVYSERGAATTNPGEKKLYDWLAQWERGHLAFLAGLNEELREEIWDESGFWPF